MTGVTCGFDHLNLLLRARPHAARSAGADRSVVHVASVRDGSTNLRPSMVRPAQDGRGGLSAFAQVSGSPLRKIDDLPFMPT